MARNGNNNAAIASGVEQCECSEIYSGSSCQNPADGFFRWRNTTVSTNLLEDLVGKVVPCECNDRSETCDKETGECLVRVEKASFKVIINKGNFIFSRSVNLIQAVSIVKNVLKDFTVILILNVSHVPAQKRTEIMRADVSSKTTAFLAFVKKATVERCVINVLEVITVTLKKWMENAKVAIVILKALSVTNVTIQMVNVIARKVLLEGAVINVNYLAIF